MVTKPTSSTAGTPAVPSRNALRLLRRLALAGSTVGSFCTVAAITYDMHRRVRVAERIVENKRALQTSAPNYDATSAARRLARMMEAAEAGEFNGSESVREDSRKLHDGFQVDSPVNAGSHGLEIDPAIEELKALEKEDTLPEATQLDRPDTYWQYPKRLRFKYTNKTGFGSVVKKPNTDRIGMKELTSSIEEGTPAAQQMQILLDHDRPIEAAQIFLEAHPASLKGISTGRKELAKRAFYVNCNQENVFMARSIFERLEEVDQNSVTPRMWNELLFALAKKGSIESTASLFSRYRTKFRLQPEMVDIVLRSLLESHRLATAKWLIMRNLHVDRDCGLCGAYLTGLWKKTRSIELMNTQLMKLLAALPKIDKPPTDKLFNPVVKAYIEFGRLGDAEALVQKMLTTCDLPLNCRTMGLLVHGRALRCDWEGVEYGLQKMHDLGLTRRRFDFVRIFDRIFLEYWVSHSGREIRDYVFRCIDKFDIVPDRVLYKHILEAFVEKGDRDMIAEMIDMARERSWKIKVNEEEFLETLRARRLALEDSPVGFWQMLQAARIRHGQAAASQQILGYDQRSFPSPEVNKLPFTQQPMPWYERSLKEVTSSRSVDQYQRLHKQMSHFMHAGKMAEALKCFNTGKKAGFHMKQIHLELAAIATLLEHGITATRAFIDVERQGLPEWSNPRFFTQIMEVSGTAESEQVKMAIFRFYQLCLINKKMNLKHHITVATSRRLIVLGKPDIALDLLTTVYMSRYRAFAKFDGICLKMFMRVFAELGSLAGIRWGILSGLARRGPVTWDLVVEARRVLGALHREFSASPSPAKTEQLEYLDHIADLLEQKSEKDISKSEPEINREESAPRQDRLDRPLDEASLYRKENIHDILEGWDEKYELESVLLTMDKSGGEKRSNDLGQKIPAC
ncbi:pentatricopeptide repeat protein [Aspergillus chevalieri]|uniref:Pentatricopeptide repeat protein n=1 Tax=Aspergillus chevalieri TaxID=182096 RepID=A0A7R7VJJ4_ASPCH|nr:uncharacterized protein ACHE_21334S [Aspergillus chevalieri]BCR85876.1 hypothetical protein ACHE_21334S [Aspergillus chevalieri]